MDWSKTYKGALRGDRGKHGSYADLLQSQQAKMAEAQKAQAAFKKAEPILKQMLLDYMVNRKPITVLSPISFHTEMMVKSDSGASFQAGIDTIPVGTELTYSHLEKTMGQWIFKSEEGREFEIYTTPMIMVPGGHNMPSQYVPNPGFYGLLTRTNIYKAVMEAMEDVE